MKPALLPLARIDLICEQEELYTRDEIISSIRKIVAEYAQPPNNAALSVHTERAVMKKFWCWLRNHPYPWIRVCEQEEWPFNSAPPSKCSNCGSRWR